MQKLIKPEQELDQKTKMILTKVNEQWIEDFYDKFSDDLPIDKYEENLTISGGVPCFKHKALCCIDIFEQHYLVGIITKDELFEYIMSIREVIANGKEL